MIEDMSLRNLAPRTQEAYIRGCKKLAAFLRRSPDTATAEDIRLFQLRRMPKARRSANSHKAGSSALASSPTPSSPRSAYEGLHVGYRVRYDLGEQGVLVAIIVVQGALREPGRGRNLLHRRALIADALEEHACRIHDGGARSQDPRIVRARPVRRPYPKSRGK
jgi:hypothetical protein